MRIHQGDFVVINRYDTFKGYLCRVVKIRTRFAAYELSKTIKKFDLKVLHVSENAVVVKDANTLGFETSSGFLVFRGLHKPIIKMCEDFAESGNIEEEKQCER